MQEEIIHDLKQQQILQKWVNSELKNTQKEKDEFVAMISHDLKQPLITIQGYVDMLKMKKIGELTDKQKECVDEITSYVKQQVFMIDNLVSAQKIGAGSMEYNIEELSSKEILNACIKRHSLLMNNKKIEYFDSSTLNIKIKADRRRILEVFTNLIQNAYDFVPKNGKIEIGVNEGKNQVIFFVKDNGIGILKQQQELIFKKYGQVKSKIERKCGGTGLGLVISQELIEGMQGEIWIKSIVNRGTTFFFSIPKVEIEKGKTSFEKYEDDYVARYKKNRSKKGLKTNNLFYTRPKED